MYMSGVVTSMALLIRQSEIEMEGLTSQYYNSARNNLLLSLLHGLEERTDGETGCQADYYFPLDWEIQLITQLRAGNVKAVGQILRELGRENLSRSLNAAEHRQLMTMLAEILHRVAQETNGGLKDFSLRLVAAADMENREAAWETMGKLAQELCPVSEEIDGEQTMGERIRQYLHEHFRDANLSQKVIADEFGLSCPHMSRMFKRTTGKNFIDYLQELRITAARNAFDAGETDVIAVAHSCGYENEVMFRRAFFRIYAISPRQYVNQLGEEKK